jgi:aryl-alcohol dehydrogenase-like predicted oxidoreductase
MQHTSKRQREQDFMETIEIAGSDMVASRIALGTWAIGGRMWGGTSARDAIRTFHAALDRGITLIDTAPVYGFGRAEELVGKALEIGSRREGVLIATKAGLEWHDEKISRNASPRRLRQEVELSLRRLRTDRIDLYQLHWPDPATPITETAAALGQLVKEGKVRAIGVSNLSPAQLDEFRRVTPVRTTQPPYNLFERSIEKDVLPHAVKNGVVVLAYGALCRGLLSGKITASMRFEGDDLRRSDPKFAQPRLAQYLEAVRGLDRFARDNYGKSVLALAVRWILDQGPTIALWGARRPEQLNAVDDVMGWTLDIDAKREIDGILERTIQSPVGPEFMAPPTTRASLAVV